MRLCALSEKAPIRGFFITGKKVIGLCTKNVGFRCTLTFYRP